MSAPRWLAWILGGKPDPLDALKGAAPWPPRATYEGPPFETLSPALRELVELHVAAGQSVSIVTTTYDPYVWHLTSEFDR